MRNLPVHWSEGMFLRPQHFQAADRHWSELIATSSHWANPYDYGIWHVEISRDALANYQLQVTACELRMRDGTVICDQDGRAPDRVDLKEAFSTSSEVTAYLAIPKLTMGRANVTPLGAPSSNNRYSSLPQSVQDEGSGGSDQEINFRDHNTCILLSTQGQSGFETLPIARIKRAGHEEATPEIDEDYFPPCLATTAWEPLNLGVVRSIYDRVGERIEILADRANERNMKFSSQQPGDLEDLMMLSTLNESYSVLHCLSFAQGVHPFLAYTEMCRLVGALSVFDGGRVVGDIPAYDHDDLARIFRWIRIRLDELLGARKKLEFEQRPFIGAERGMQVALEPEWFHSGWDWYVGVNGQNISDAECRELLRPGNLDWKMGSAQQIDLIFRHGLPGVEQKELSRAPRALPPHGWVYYQIDRQNNAWKDVLATQTLSVRFQEELIGNLDKLSGQQRLEVVFNGKMAILEVSLFAVPKGTAVDRGK